MKFMNIVINPKNTTLRNNVLFILIFASMAISYYDGILTKGILSEHQWRQTDCLSFAYNYSKGSSLFEPEMMLQIGDKNTSGQTVGEFPILYFIVGKIWSFTGESYFVFRLTYLLIIASALFSLFNALLLVFKNSIWSAVLTLLLFTSPVFVFYGVSFLTDVPAFCFMLIGASLLVRHHYYPSKKIFFLAMFFFALGGVLKSTSLIVFVFLGAIFLLELLGAKSLGKEKLFKNPGYQFVGFSLAFVSIVIWYYSAVQYNHRHHFHFTSNSIHPFWISSKNDLWLVWLKFKTKVSYLFYSRQMLYTFLGLGIFNLFTFKKVPLIVYLANLLILVGTMVYIALWAPLFGVHDYYYTPLLVWVLSTLLPFAWFIKSNHSKVFHHIVTKVSLVAFLLFNFFYCLNIFKIKTLGKEINIIKTAPNDFYSMQTWFVWDNEMTRRFEDMKPYLIQLGIKPDDKVISFPDESFNTTLYLMKRKGWTNYLHYNSSTQIEELLKKGAKYLFIANPDLCKEKYLLPFVKEQIGNYKGILIFKL